MVVQDMTEVHMPELGEAITEGTVTQWFKEVGDPIEQEDALFEVSTDKVDAEIPSPLTGRLAEIRVAVGESVPVGAVVAVIETATPTAAPSERVTVAAAPIEAQAPTETTPPPTPPEEPPTPPAPSPGSGAGSSSEPLLMTSPIVRRLLRELGPDAGMVVPTGPNRRVTRRDAEVAAAAQGRSLREPPRSRGARQPVVRPRAAGQGFVAFSKTRRVTGERMVTSKAVAPHVMTAVEVDYERIDAVRREHQEEWRRAEGFSLSYLPFICRAIPRAMEDFPHLNATVVEGGLTTHGHVDLNIAVDLEFEGLIAPVVREVESKRLITVAREISDLASRARNSRLRADELASGAFTISNSGSFGTFMVAPIINQPQVAILSTDGVSRRPVVVVDDYGGESIAIHSVGMLVLSWDHRAFDGAYAAAFLRTLKFELEHRDWEAELLI
jgi:2-oxoglutarate dehydrogenase E2 component (dihydrolipoamide succinyltransferase)